MSAVSRSHDQDLLCLTFMPARMLMFRPSLSMVSDLLLDMFRFAFHRLDRPRPTACSLLCFDRFGLVDLTSLVSGLAPLDIIPHLKTNRSVVSRLAISPILQISQNISRNAQFCNAIYIISRQHIQSYGCSICRPRSIPSHTQHDSILPHPLSLPTAIGPARFI